MGALKKFSTNHNLSSAKMHPNLHTTAGNDKRTVAASGGNGGGKSRVVFLMTYVIVKYDI